MKKLKFIFIFFCLFNVSLLQAATYYFSASGSDSYTAAQAQNEETPWQTISKLNSIMGLLQPGDKVLFKRGDSFSGTISIGKSGTAGNPITFGAYGTGTAKPVLDGRLTLTGWTNLGGNIWEASNSSLTSQPTALMINDVLEPLGRYPNIDAPNRGYLTISSHPTGSKTVFTDNTLSASPDWTGAEIVVRTLHYWLDRSTIASHSGQTITLNSNTNYPIQDNYGYFFQNHPAALDTDGEWCYLNTGNKIRLYSITDPNTKVIKVANTLDYIFVYSKSYLVIDGLVLIGAKRYCIDLRITTYCTIKNCDFVASGGNAMNIGTFGATDNDSITVMNNTFTQTLGDGINAYGKRLAFVGNIMKHQGMVPGMAGAGSGRFAINSLADGLLIKRNVIDSVGYTGINILWSTNVEISENVVNHFCSVMDDGGGIYCRAISTVPLNRKIINNIVLNGMRASEGTGDTQPSTEGIYLDDGSPNVDVSGNTVAFCANSGIFLHNAPKNKVKNNTVFSCGTALRLKHDNIAPTFPIIDCDIKSNILCTNTFNANESLLNYQTRLASELSTLGALDSNYYCRPYSNINCVIYRIFDSSLTTQTFLDLPGWLAFSSYDTHSKELSPENSLGNYRFEYNATNTSKIVTLDGRYISADNQIYNGSISLNPYSSVVLTKYRKYEAEYASLNGGQINTNHTGYSGNGFWAWVTTSGNSLQFTVTSASNVNADITCRYSNGHQASVTHTLSLYVNGTKIKQVSFSPTTNWNTWADRVDNVPLIAGTNTITYQYDSADDGNVNIDYISVSPYVVSSNYEAESATLNGGQINANHTGYSDTGFWAWVTTPGNSLQFTVTSASNGNADITCRYSNGHQPPATATHTLSLYVNGIKIRQVSFSPTTDWNTWTDRVDNVPLIAGSNTIRYQYDSSDDGNVNIDYIRLGGTHLKSGTLVTALEKDELKAAFNVKLFPNPATDQLNVQFGQSITNEAFAIITDLNGRIMARFKLESGNTFTQLSIGNFPSGIYLVSICDGENKLVKKLIVNK